MTPLTVEQAAHATIFPFECPLCFHRIASAADRTEWHGLGNCADLCSLCSGSGKVETKGYYRNTKPQQSGDCPACAGTGVENGPTL